MISDANHLYFLGELLPLDPKKPKARLISRAHLPRLLALVPLDDLNDIVEVHFGVRLAVNGQDEWTAIDSKTLRGTTSAHDKQGERTLLAVAHSKRNIPFRYDKEGNVIQKIAEGIYQMNDRRKEETN